MLVSRRVLAYYGLLKKIPNLISARLLLLNFGLLINVACFFKEAQAQLVGTLVAERVVHDYER